MEQYEIPPSRYFQALCDTLKHFRAESVYVRLVGSCGGTVKVDEDVSQKKLVLKQRRHGLEVVIDGQTRFLFEQRSPKKYQGVTGKRWSIAPFRIDDQGRMHNASTGYPNHQEPHISGPNDLQLPEVKKTIFRSCNMDHLIEITFTGKVPIRRLVLKIFPRYEHWYYWDLDYARFPVYSVLP